MSEISGALEGGIRGIALTPEEIVGMKADQSLKGVAEITQTRPLEIFRRSPGVRLGRLLTEEEIKPVADVADWHDELGV